MAQTYSLKARLKRFGEKREHAVNSEIDQLNDMETFTTINTNKTTKKDRSEALESLMFPTEKGTRELKGEHVPMGKNKSHT